MTATPQSQAIQVANQLFSNASALMAIYQSQIAIDNTWNDNTVGATLNAMSTVALNSDGTAGSADGSPNVAHPLSPTLYPTLQHMLSSNQISSIKTILDEIVTYINGQAVATQAAARAILNSGIGG
jgi:hypothetical protein